MLQSTFDPDNVEKLRPMMQDTVDAILDKLLKKGGSTPIDFIEEFATPVPTQVRYLWYETNRCGLTSSRSFTNSLGCLTKTSKFFPKTLRSGRALLQVLPSLQISAAQHCVSV